MTGREIQKKELQLLRSRNVTPTGKDVYRLLQIYRNSKTALAWPSIKRIAEELDLPSRKVKAAVAELEEKKFLKIRKRTDDRRRSAYFFTFFWALKNVGKGSVPSPNPEENRCPVWTNRCPDQSPKKVTSSVTYLESETVSKTKRNKFLQPTGSERTNNLNYKEEENRSGSTPAFEDAGLAGSEDPKRSRYHFPDGSPIPRWAKRFNTDDERQAVQEFGTAEVLAALEKKPNGKTNGVTSKVNGGVVAKVG